MLPAQILAVAGMIAAILTGFAQVLLAAGRPRALLRFNIGVLAVYAGAVWVTAAQGIVAVAIAVVGVYLGQLVVVYGILFRRVVGIPVGRMVGDLAPAVVGRARCWRSASRSARPCAGSACLHRSSWRPWPAPASPLTCSSCGRSSPRSGATSRRSSAGCCRSAGRRLGPGRSFRRRRPSRAGARDGRSGAASMCARAARRRG